jgi:hypothetical protein
MPLELADRAFAALAEEPYLESIHIGGGEAMLNLPHLVELIRRAGEHKLRISYLETNGFWAVGYDRAVDVFQELADAGLTSVLVSVSPFHNEFIPFEQTRTAVEAARRVFGSANTMLWTAEMYRAYCELDEHTTHTLEQSVEVLGLQTEEEIVWGAYPLVPSGRAVDALRTYYPARPAAELQGATCKADLLDTSHFHIDPYGNVFTGLCPGLQVATVDDLHPDLYPEQHPIVTTLMQHGPHGLMELAMEHGYRPSEGYVGKCDLCLDVRRHLHQTGLYAELQPSAFYEVD